MIKELEDILKDYVEVGYGFYVIHRLGELLDNPEDVLTDDDLEQLVRNLNYGSHYSNRGFMYNRLIQLSVKHQWDNLSKLLVKCLSYEDDPSDIVEPKELELLELYALKVES